MRYCPSCGTQYTDDTLRFCLQDGSPLFESREAATRAVAPDETPTVLRRPAMPTTFETSKNVRVKANRRSRFYLILIAGVGAAILFIGGAMAAWIYLSGKANNVSKNTVNAISTPKPGNTNVFVPTPGPRVTSTPSPLPSETPARIDIGQAERNVSDVVSRWKTNTEGMDLVSYMDNYAAEVDYYNRRGTSRSSVQKDKARAFGMYSSMRMELSNVKISLDENGNRATAVFDKEWEFRGGRPSSGKVRSELRLRRDGERWLITGERDLKVYYVN